MTSRSTEDHAVGIVGLGDMGHAIASRLIESGQRVVVYDVRPAIGDDLVERGASRATSIADLTSRTSFIGIVVGTDAQVTEVCARVVDAAHAETVIVLHSTVLPDTAIAVAESAALRAVRMLDAPVSGGNEKAALGNLTIMAGGSDEVFAHCRPLLDTLARHIFHVGAVGAGSAAKLANNLLSQAGYALQLEAMQLAALYDITEDAMVSIAVVSGGDSRGLRTWGRLDRLRRSHTFAGTNQMYEFLAKDIANAVIAASQRNVVLPIAAVAARASPVHMQLRDEVLVELPAVPLCRACNQELAAPFRETGVHPECQE